MSSYSARQGSAPVLAWSHAGTDALLPESIESDTVSASTRDAVRLLELERIGLRPPSGDRLPTMLEIAEFHRLVDRTGGPTACHHHANKTMMIAGASRKIRYVAYVLAEGSWAPGHLTTSCGSDRCANRTHILQIHAAEDVGTTPLPSDEVAKFLGVSDAYLDTLCRRILARKTITPRGLDKLVEAHRAMGGELP